MIKYDFETVNENAFRIKDTNGFTKAYVSRTFYDTATLGFYIPAFPERKDPKYQTEAWRSYKKALHNRIVWTCSSAFKVGCWIIDKQLTDYVGLFRCKDQLYLISSRYNNKEKEYEIDVKFCPWRDSLYKDYKLFGSEESWSHFDNSITYYNPYIPDCWK